MKARKVSAHDILLVSRDRTVLRQLRACLPETGLAPNSLQVVKDGQECLKALDKLRPRLVVLDDGLDDMEGLTLLRNLHRQVSDAYVIYLATRHTADLERAVRQLGVLYYTEKPPDSFLLGRLLASVFASLSEVGQRPRL
jgi:DNA-binding response OmpR family regulator